VLLAPAFLLLLPPSRGAAYRAPLGYYIDSAQVFASRPTWRDAPDGDFTFHIKREYSDLWTERMLRIAESCYPPRDLLVDIAATRYYEMGSDTTKTPLWWADGDGVRRVAWAVTAGALEHYLGMTERFRHHDYLVAGGRGLYFTDLRYDAVVKAMPEFAMKQTEYHQVYVVYLLLGWSFDDGVFISYFEAHRIVVLDQEGNVLAIEGDGRTVQDYRLSGHIEVGRRERVYR
jgi:hypothetical protein